MRETLNANLFQDRLQRFNLILGAEHGTAYETLHILMRLNQGVKCRKVGNNRINRARFLGEIEEGGCISPGKTRCDRLLGGHQRVSRFIKWVSHTPYCVRPIWLYETWSQGLEHARFHRAGENDTEGD